MPDAARTGVIFLVLGFVMYLAWKNQLGTFLSLATKTTGATGSGLGTVYPANTVVGAAQSAVSTAGAALAGSPTESYEYGEGN